MRAEPARRIPSNSESDDPGTNAGLSAFAAPLEVGRYQRIAEADDLAREAKENGPAVLSSGCPRGGDLSTECETGIEVVSRAAHMSALRGAHVMRFAFGGRRIVFFSGSASKGTDALLGEVRAIRDGGAHGSIIGRNTFQRSSDDAPGLPERIAGIHAEGRPAPGSGEPR